MAPSPGACSTACSKTAAWGFDAITGASAGAMNAAVLAHGWVSDPKNPAEGARRALEAYWRAISVPSGFGGQTIDGNANSIGTRFMEAAGLGEFARAFALDRSPAVVAFDLLTRVASPYQFNPFNANPLRDVLDGLIDFERLRAQSPFKLRICATSVRTGRPRIFFGKRTHDRHAAGLVMLPFFVSRRPRSTASISGTAAIRAIRRCFRCAHARRSRTSC